MKARTAIPADAAAIAGIYNEGLEGRVATRSSNARGYPRLV
jgi:L-amino acid N-acyltransferase YncA